MGETATIATPDTSRHLATLGPSVRLVVFKFLVRSDLVPAFIPRIPITNSHAVTPATQGREVLASTPSVWLAGLRTGLLNSRGNYLLVGARVAGERSRIKTKWINGVQLREEIITNDVRFTFCHRKHVSGESHPDFAEKFNIIVNVFVDWTKSNLWDTMAHLNPYFDLESGSAVNGATILMFGCAGRTLAVNPDGTPVMVYEGGREKPAAPGQIGQGIGEKVPLLNLAPEIQMSGNKVLFVPCSR